MQTQAQTSLKTTKGTTLPLLSLKGKSYLQVAHRLVWFREDHPDWQIITEIVTSDQAGATMRASIKNSRGDVMATAHKTEHKAHFPDYLEKAETGAVGRALAMVGYGTQFAPELDEEDRIVDAPMPLNQKQGATVNPPQGVAKRPVAPPPAKQATKPLGAPKLPGGSGRPAQSTVSRSEISGEQGDFASYNERTDIRQ